VLDRDCDLIGLRPLALGYDQHLTRFLRATADSRTARARFGRRARAGTRLPPVTSVAVSVADFQKREAWVEQGIDAAGGATVAGARGGGCCAFHRRFGKRAPERVQVSHQCLHGRSISRHNSGALRLILTVENTHGSFSFYKGAFL